MSLSIYNTTRALFAHLSIPSLTIPIVTISSIGLLLYTIIAVACIVCIILTRAYLMFCGYKWKAEKHKKLYITHLLLMGTLIGCMYKMSTLPVLIYEQFTLQIGPEIICFLVIGLCSYDVLFAALSFILLRTLIPTLLNPTMRTIVQIISVVNCIIPCISLLNALYTTFALTIPEHTDTLGYMMYTVTLPILFTNKILLLIISIAVCICMISSLRRSPDMEMKRLSIKIGIIMILCILANLAMIIGAALTYVLGIVAVTTLYTIPDSILYVAIIIAFYPRRKKVVPKV